MSIDSFRLRYNIRGGGCMKLSIGERVRNLREDADLTQSQLGNAVQMTQRKISYIECGKYEPNIDDIILLCRFFNVTSDYLIGLSSRKNPNR